MPNHISFAHSRLKASNHLTITHDRTFNGKPLYYHEGGLILEYLADIDQVLTEALNQYPRLFAVHLNFNLPSHFRGDYLTVFTHFFHTFESETNELCKDKYTGRTYRYQQTVIRYIWAKASESTSQYHLVLLLDRRLYHCLGRSGDGRSRYLSRVRKAWDRAVEKDHGRRCSGLAYSPSDDVYELLKGGESFPLQLNEVFYRISRLAKPTTKHDDNRSTSFGCSHNSP